MATEKTQLDESLTEEEQKDAVLALHKAMPEEEKTHLMRIITKDDLVKIGTHKKRLTSLKRKYGGNKIQFTNVDDKAMIELADNAARDFRKLRLEVEAERKAINAPMDAGIKFVNSNYKPIVTEIEEEESPVKSVREQFKQAIIDKANEERLAKNRLANERRDKALNAGMAFDGSYYSVGSEEFGVDTISLGMVDFETMTDASFDIVLSKIEEAAEIIRVKTTEKEAALKLAAEKKAAEEKAERERFEAEQAALKAEREKFAAEQESFRKQQAEMKAAQEALAEQQRQAELQRKIESERIENERITEIERKEKERQDKILALVNSRKQEMIELGLSTGKSSNDYSFNDIVFVTESQVLDTENKWDEIMSNVIDLVNEQKGIIQAKKEAAQKAEEERIAAKAIEDKRLADEQAESERLEALAAADDSVKWENILKQLNEVVLYEMTTKKYQEKIGLIKDFIADLK